RPPCSTLFPYTTLFRSWQRCRTHYAANLMSVTPKSLWPAVKAMLHSVYDQPDKDAVNAQFDRLLDYVEDKLPARCRGARTRRGRSEEHTSELQSREKLV